MNFAHLTILLFHALNVDRIDTTTTATNPQVMLPIINGPVGNCCNQDVHFMRVQCILNFTPLTTIDPYPVSPILRVSYYIKLPQGSHPMLNGDNQGYTLVSFLGPNDLHLLPPDVMNQRFWSLFFRMVRSCLDPWTSTSKMSTRTPPESVWRLTERSSSSRGTSCVQQFLTSYAQGIPTSPRLPWSTSSNPILMVTVISFACPLLPIIKG